jgi:hypothetical protein
VKLRHAPDTPTIARLYHELARLGARVEGEPSAWPYGEPTPEEVVSLAAQASRHDARLLWVLVEFLATSFDRLNPLLLRRALSDARWPAALGVAFAFARRANPSPELSDYADFVLRRIPRASGERFFIHGRAFAGRTASRDVEEPLDEYVRWGFFGREEPLAKELGGTAHGTLGPRARLALLRRIAERRRTLTLADYLAELRGRASPRQARRDLASAPFLVAEGRTRGTRYRYAPKADAASAGGRAVAAKPGARRRRVPGRS